MRDLVRPRPVVLCARDRSHKTLHKIFIREKSCARPVRVLGLLREVSCKSCADFFVDLFFC